MRKPSLKAGFVCIDEHLAQRERLRHGAAGDSFGSLTAKKKKNTIKRFVHELGHGECLIQWPVVLDLFMLNQRTLSATLRSHVTSRRSLTYVGGVGRVEVGEEKEEREDPHREKESWRRWSPSRSQVQSAFRSKGT